MRNQPRKEVCPTCQGTGKTFVNKSIYEWGSRVCGDCKGTGFVEINPPPQRLRIG